MGVETYIQSNVNNWSECQRTFKQVQLVIDGMAADLYLRRFIADAALSEAISGPGSGPVDATYIVQTPHAGLSAEQALSALATGILKSTTGTGVVSLAVAGTDYSAPGHTHTEYSEIGHSHAGVREFRIALIESGMPVAIT